MNPTFRTVALIAASLGLLVSLFVALRSDGEDPAPLRIVDIDASSGTVVRPPAIERGSRVVLNVTAEVSDRVHVHGYDLRAAVAPGRPAKLSFTADTSGRFEVELEERHVPIAELEVP